MAALTPGVENSAFASKLYMKSDLKGCQENEIFNQVGLPKIVFTVKEQASYLILCVLGADHRNQQFNFQAPEDFLSL
jgi:hypothetical protein